MQCLEYTGLYYARAVKQSDKRPRKSCHHVDFLAFTAGYARKEAQVHADMRLVYTQSPREEKFFQMMPR